MCYGAAWGVLGVPEPGAYALPGGHINPKPAHSCSNKAKQWIKRCIRGDYNVENAFSRLAHFSIGVTVWTAEFLITFNWVLIWLLGNCYNRFLERETKKLESFLPPYLPCHPQSPPKFSSWKRWVRVTLSRKVMMMAMKHKVEWNQVNHPDATQLSPSQSWCVSV